ncbi:GntR family transcriptional regulator [uncultured Sulfitobacter sp.]|uniref:GntR family transcriptional regulator n=1 Tax=uncultured Sulfitobacter sp. TaxID=191468 RepID=UPI002603997C|nr:GntR family transcriptional regulator [uncultured Sulfitobacter sp.]
MEKEKNVRENSKLVLEREAIVEDLRLRIVNLDLPSGSKLREEELAASYGVSRARLREAFLLLEDRGLIEREPNRGATVAGLNLKKATELFELRSVLEGLAARLATKRAPDGAWDDLIELFGKPALDAIKEHDMEFYLSCVAQFRARTVDLADNALLSKSISLIVDQTSVLMKRLVLVPGRAETGVEANRQILIAMRDRDHKLAEQLKRENIENARRDYKRYEAFVK